VPAARRRRSLAGRGPPDRCVIGAPHRYVCRIGHVKPINQFWASLVTTDRRPEVNGWTASGRSLRRSSRPEPGRGSTTPTSAPPSPGLLAATSAPSRERAACGFTTCGTASRSRPWPGSMPTAPTHRHGYRFRPHILGPVGAVVHLLVPAGRAELLAAALLLPERLPGLFAMIALSPRS
jgi:hypothetical protein